MPAGSYLVGPFAGGASVIDHLHVGAGGRNEEEIGIGEAAGPDAIDPDCERRSEGSARFFGGTDKIGESGITGSGDTAADPAHAAGLFDSIGKREAEVAMEVLADEVCIQVNGFQKRRKATGESCLARARQTHYQNFQESGVGRHVRQEKSITTYEARGLAILTCTTGSCLRSPKACRACVSRWGFAP